MYIPVGSATRITPRNLVVRSRTPIVRDGIEYLAGTFHAKIPTSVQRLGSARVRDSPLCRTTRVLVFLYAIRACARASDV